MPFCYRFFLFIGIFSANQNGSTSEFEPGTPQEQVALEVAQYVQQKGGTKEFAAAWIGNMEHESGLIPSRIQSDLAFNPVWAYNPEIGGYAMGLAQWDSSSHVNMLNLPESKMKIGRLWLFKWILPGIMTNRIVTY